MFSSRRLIRAAAMATAVAAFSTTSALAAPAPSFTLELRGDCTAGLVATMTWDRQPAVRSYELVIVQDGTSRDLGTSGAAKRSGSATDSARLAADVTHSFVARGILRDRAGNAVVDRIGGSFTGDCALSR